MTAERTRRCGFCELEVTADGRGHALDCLAVVAGQASGEAAPAAAALQAVVAADITPEQRAQMIAALPAAYRQYAEEIPAEAVQEMLDNVRSWKGNVETFEDWLLESNMMSVQVLRRIIASPPAGRTGPSNQRNAIKLLADMSTVILPHIQAALARKAQSDLGRK